MTLVESLRMEVSTIASIQGVSAFTPSFQQGMHAIGVKMQAAADEIERLERAAKTVSPDQEELRQLRAMRDGIKDMLEEATKWRALMACARIKMMGGAGLHPESPTYADPEGHVGMEFWTHHEASGDAQDVQGRIWFGRFMVKALKAYGNRLTPPG